MQITESKHVRDNCFGYVVDMYNADLNGVESTLKWAFPLATLTKNERGAWVLVAEGGLRYSIVLDLYELRIYVEEL